MAPTGLPAIQGRQLLIGLAPRHKIPVERVDSDTAVLYRLIWAIDSNTTVVNTTINHQPGLTGDGDPRGNVEAPNTTWPTVPATLRNGNQ